MPPIEEEPSTTERVRETLPTDELPPSETRADEHPATTIRPTTTSGQPIVVVNPDGDLLPTQADGQFVFPDNSPVVLI